MVAAVFKMTRGSICHHEPVSCVLDSDGHKNLKLMLLESKATNMTYHKHKMGLRILSGYHRFLIKVRKKRFAFLD